MIFEEVMTKTKRTNKESSNKIKSSPFKDYWKKINYILFLSGIGILILGYFLMTQSPWDNPVSLSISPVVLLIGYVIIIPLSILFGNSKKKKNVSIES